MNCERDMKPWTSVLGPSFARTFFCEHAAKTKAKKGGVEQTSSVLSASLPKTEPDRFRQSTQSDTFVYKCHQ